MDSTNTSEEEIVVFRRPSFRAEAIKGIIRPNGCIECTSHKPDSGGYPRIFLNGTSVRIGRFFLRQLHGPLTSTIVMRHTCDNRLCINIEHLITGTRTENAQDRVMRNRVPKGSACGNVRLNEDSVRQILRSTASKAQLARQYSVSKTTISAIRNGKTWKHLPESPGFKAT